jgi:hypothetical protein
MRFILPAGTDEGGNSMTSVLAEKTCTPCRGGVPPLTVGEAEAYRVQAPEWVLQDEATRIERTYRFRSLAMPLLSCAAPVSEARNPVSPASRCWRSEGSGCLVDLPLGWWRLC